MRSLAARQLELLRSMAALDPPPCVMGGFAEDALLAGAVTRPHKDIDWLFPRRELELRLEQAAQLGFESFETWGESAPGEPFYLYGENGDVKLDLGVADKEDGALWVKVHRIFFEVEGGEAPAGYRAQLPPDMFTYPHVELEGIAIHTASPLALYQLRAGIASQGSSARSRSDTSVHWSSCARRSFPTVRRPTSCLGSSRCSRPRRPSRGSSPFRPAARAPSPPPRG